jgi:CRISPR/Cas system-associated protein endoribonuclease Cas2
VELMKVMIKKMFGENPRETNTVARIVNEQHFLRLKNLLSDSAVQNSIVYGGSTDEKNLYDALFILSIYFKCYDIVLSALLSHYKHALLDLIIP